MSDEAMATDTAQLTDTYGMTATYSPEDNKLRLYSATRLDADTYQRVKAAGFSWAPRQQLFVAPMWTPHRADFLAELCGDIGDEDTTLVDRAEMRADRFEDYSIKRAREGDAAHKQVLSITQHIPLGQPILVGHHSERRARKDAERIENGMRKAVQRWETSAYWTQRAKGALCHAKYKERADVRARRIKKIEAELRKQLRVIDEHQERLTLWQREGLTHERALAIANYEHIHRCFTLAEFPRNPPASQYEGQMGLWSALEGGIITAEQARDIALAAHPRVIAYAQRWVQHYENRLAYERAMLDDAGGTEADRNRPEKGGACRSWVSRSEWLFIVKVNKVSVTLLDNWGNGGKDFTRTIPFDKLQGLMSRAQVEAARSEGRLIGETSRGFQLAKQPPAPALASAASSTSMPSAATPATHVDSQALKQVRAQLAEGVHVVSAPQLFPTPAALAARMVDCAQITPEARVLEPSAGTLRIVNAVLEIEPTAQLVAVEINPRLADVIKQWHPSVTTNCADFLEFQDSHGFDCILMNPPFENGSDIAHIKHAITMLRGGGVLVGICANGPRQQRELRPLIEASGGDWEPLPAETFAESGTSVNTVLLTYRA